MTSGMGWGRYQEDQSQVAIFSWGEGRRDSPRQAERQGSMGRKLARAAALESNQLG